MIAEERLKEFEVWFYQRKYREISPYRELAEELVIENEVFSSLPRDAISLEYITTTCERAVTERQWQEGKTTQRYFEVYETRFKPEYEEIIKNTLMNPAICDLSAKMRSGQE